MKWFTPVKNLFLVRNVRKVFQEMVLWNYMKKFIMVKNHINTNIAPSYERIHMGEKPLPSEYEYKAWNVEIDDKFPSEKQL